MHGRCGAVVAAVDDDDDNEEGEEADDGYVSGGRDSDERNEKRL